MFNCLAKNAAVTEVSFEDAKKLLLDAREQRVFWDEQTLGIFFLRSHQETVAGCAIATGVLGGTDTRYFFFCPGRNRLGTDNVHMYV